MIDDAGFFTVSNLQPALAAINRESDLGDNTSLNTPLKDYNTSNTANGQPQTGSNDMTQFAHMLQQRLRDSTIKQQSQ